MNDNVIEVYNLKKYYKDVKAVDDISFKVKRGELFAFLGLNGAGKSTTINIMTGVLQGDEGHILVNGLNVNDNVIEVKKSIGVVFQSSVLDRNLTAYENLISRGNLYGLRGESLKNRIVELSELLEFESFLKKPICKLSGGQKRKIDIARALINKPNILILDEPTTGLDPKTRKLMWKVLSKLREEDGLTIFLTTHYMEEASNADYIVIIDEGKIVASDTPNHLKEKYTGDFIKVYKGNFSEEELKKYCEDNKYQLKETRDAYLIEVIDTLEAKKIILEKNELFNDFEVYKGNMDDVFLNVTGKKLKEEE